MPEDFLPPPPPKKKAVVNTEVEGVLPPPPPKKKVYTETSESSATPSVSVSTSENTPPTEKPKPFKLGFGGDLGPTRQETTEQTIQVQVQDRPKPIAPTKEPMAEAFLTKKKEEEKPQNVLNGIKEDVKKMASVGVFNTTDLFNKNSDVYAEHYLDDTQKQEYGFVKGIQQLQSQLKLDPNNPQLKADLDVANQSYQQYVQQKNAAIDAQIAELDAKTYDIADNQKKIATLRAQKEDFFGDKVQKAYTDNKAQIDELKIEGKTPKEQMVNYYLVLQKKAEQLQNKLYPNGIADVVRISTPFLASNYEESLKKQLDETESTLKQLSPVVLINRTPLKSDEGFWSSALKSATNVLLPNTEGVVMTEGAKANLLNAATVQAGLNPKDINKAVTTNIEDKTGSERAFTANWWGNLTGTSAGMIPSFMGGSALLKGVPAVAKFNQALNTTKFGKFIASAATTGAEYQAAGFLAPDGSTVSDEATFMSGFLGGAFGQVAGKVFDNKTTAAIFNKIFDNKASAAAEIVANLGRRTSAGIGETGEELGNSIGQLVDVYQKTGNWEEVKKQFNDQFGTMDKNLEFFVSTFVMGAAMGHGNQLGQSMSAAAKDQYDSLSTDSKEKADEFMAEMNNDIKEASVQTTKEEVANGAEAPKVEPITPEQKAEVETAKEILVNPETTPEEKVAAAEVVQKMEEQAQTNEVAEELAKLEQLRAITPIETKAEDSLQPPAESELNIEQQITPTTNEETITETTPNQEAVLKETLKNIVDDKADFTAKGGNKAVDEKGDPITVYHGTGEDFNDLDETKQNSATGHGDFGKGFYFSAREGIAKYYSLKFKNRVVKKFNINVKNPFEINIKDEIFDDGTKKALKSLRYIQDYERNIIREATDGDVDFAYKKITKEIGDKRFSDILKDNGYDAVYVNRTLGDETTPKAEIVVFDKSQIKEQKEITNEQSTKNKVTTSNVGESVQKPDVAPIEKSAKESPRKLSTFLKGETVTRTKDGKTETFLVLGNGDLKNTKTNEVKKFNLDSTNFKKKEVEIKAKNMNRGRTKQHLRKMKDPKMLKAVSKPLTDAKDVVMQYFIGGGKVSVDAISKLVKGVQKEINTRMAYKGDAKDPMLTIDKVAESIYDDMTPDMQNKVELSDIRNALDTVILDGKSPKAMAEEIVDKHYGGDTTIQENNLAEFHEKIEKIDDEVFNKLWDEATVKKDGVVVYDAMDNMTDAEIEAAAEGNIEEEWFSGEVKSTETPWDSEEQKQEAKTLADKIRKAKIDTKNKGFEATLGLPIAVWNGAVEIVASSIQAGVATVDAIKRGLNYIQKNHRGKWNKQEYNDRIIEELGFKGITVNGEDLIVKDTGKRYADVVNGFYSDIEQSLLDTKKDNLTGKDWIATLGNSDEAKWTGLTDWLNQQKGVVSKKDIEAFLKDNRVEIVEVQKGGNALDRKNYSAKKNSEGEWDVYYKGELIDTFASEEGSVINNEEDAIDVAIDIADPDVVADESGEMGTKFSQYQLEGEKENYKEVLVTMPDKGSIQKYKVEQDYRTPDTFYVVNQVTGTKIKFGSYELAKSQAERLSKTTTPDYTKQFKSSHFAEPNILVHLRMNTRTDAQGNKVLFLEEVQSDWGQKGKKEGFDRPQAERDAALAKRRVIINSITDLLEEQKKVSLKDDTKRFLEIGDEISEKQSELSKLSEIAFSQGQPTAPFVTDTNAWTKLGLKVALKEAVKQGADKIAWTTGEQQNDRYDLRKQVDEILYSKNSDGTYNIKALKDRSSLYKSPNVKESELEGAFGKDVAQKIISGEGGKTEYKNGSDSITSLKGDDLKVGGKGMKGFYGSPKEGSLGIVGNVAKSLFKQEPKTVDISTAKKSEYTLGEANYIDGVGVYDGKGDMVAEFDTKAEANKFIAEKSNQTQHSIDITPELKESVEKGLPLFGTDVIKQLNALKIDTKNTLGAFGLAPAAWNTILDGLIAAIKGGVAIKTAIDEAIVKAKAISKDFDEKGFTAKMNEIFGKKIEKEAVKTEAKTEEKAEPKEEPKAKEEPKKEKEESERPKRKTTQQFIEMYPELEGSLEDDTIYYDRLPNKVTLEEAKGIIDYLGEEEAMKAFADASNGMSWATRNTVGQLLIKKLNADGQYDKAIEVLEKLVESATELGQGIQALSMFKYLTPEGQLRVAERTRQKQNKKIVNKAQGKIDKTEKALSDINASAVDEVVKAIETKVEAVDKIVPEQKPRAKKYGESNKVVTNQRYQALKKALKGKLFSNIPPELFEIAAYHLEATGRKFADFSTEMIKDFGKKVKPYLKTLYDDAKAKLSDKYSDFESESDVNSQFDEMVSNVAFDETKKGEPKPPSVKSIIKKHYTTPSSKSLKNKLMDDAGLSEKEAQDISDAAQRAFQKLTYDRKMKVIQKAFGKSANAQKLADNLIHLSSIGALSNPQIANNYAQTMGIPSITPQQVQQITTLTNQVAAATPGFRQNRAIQQLMSYQANMKGFSKWDVAMGIWYANILSGHKTQMVNAVSNMTNALANFTVSVLRNPKKGKLLAQAYLEGAYKGYFEAMDALRTGYSPIRDKVNVPSVLERVTFKGGKFNPFNYHKYVSRIMTAVDTVFFEGAKNMREYQWADMLASNSGMPVNSTYKKRAAEYMNNNDAEITQIKAQAEQEYQDAIANGTPKKEAVRDRRRRVFELIEAARGEDIRTEGQSYGQRTTFTNPPEGLLGWAAKGLSKAGEQFKPLKLIVPFTNVIANVANAAIDYTPWGLVRAGTGGSVSSLVSERMRRKDWETMTPLQRKVAREEMLIKGMIGTASAAALFMLSQKWDDDDEPVLEITANGTGDYRKNYQLQENGWQPYSIKYKGKWYSYQNSPLLVILAFVGNIRDFEAYRNEKPTDEGAITKMALAANNTKTVFFDMTFLKGLNTFLQAVVTNKSSNPLEDAKKGVVSTAKGFVLPNLYTQFAKEIQAIYDIPQKEVGSSILGQFVRDIPVARNKYNDKINSLGDPIVADTDKFVSNVKDAPEFDLMTSHKYFLNVPSKKESFLPDADGTPRLMTEDEYYNFVKIRGAYIKQNLKENFDEYSRLSNSEFADIMGSLSGSATEIAKNEIYPEP